MTGRLADVVCRSNCNWNSAVELTGGRRLSEPRLRSKPQHCLIAMGSIGDAQHLLEIGAERLVLQRAHVWHVRTLLVSGLPTDTRLARASV